MDSKIEETATHSNGSTVLPALMAADELAQLLGIASRTVWRLKSKRAIPLPIKFGGNVRWRGQDIQQWLDKGCPEVN